MDNAITSAPPVGELLRGWRQRRHLSQLALASEAEVSQKHLSFVEGGRAAPSREMVLRLAESLEVPLRERNALLLAAGFAPVFPERPLDHADLAPAMRAVEAVLQAHDPYPALAVDRHWTLVASNAAANRLLDSVTPDLLEPPVNVLRISLHPRGLAPSIVNLAEWRGHILHRLARQYRQSCDAAIHALIAELKAMPGGTRPVPRDGAGLVALPLRLRLGGKVLSFLSTTTVFGTASEVTLSELTLETFFPADAETRAALTGSA